MTRVGVIGVGSMGRNHARVYRQLQEATLVGVADVDESVAAEVADAYDTTTFDRDTLIDRADAVSVVVPTQYHYEVAKACIEANVHVLIEKPFVNDPARGEELIELANQSDVILQVGHIERFNPAVMALDDILNGKEVLAYEVRRLGPDPGRDIQDTVVTDLMVHDIDIIRTLAGGDPMRLQATGRDDGRHASATLEFNNGTMATLTASRVTQRKIRELSIATEEGYVSVDYLDRCVEIYRDSMKQLIDGDGDQRYRHESVIERPFVENSEPLKNELSSFLYAIRNGDSPVVTAEDGLATLQLAKEIEDEAFPKSQYKSGERTDETVQH